MSGRRLGDVLSSVSPACRTNSLCRFSCVYPALRRELSAAAQIQRVEERPPREGPLGLGRVGQRRLHRHAPPVPCGWKASLPAPAPWERSAVLRAVLRLRLPFRETLLR